MNWPKYLTHNIFQSPSSALGFPLTFGTVGFPPSQHVISTQRFAHKFIELFVLSASDKLQFRTKFCDTIHAINQKNFSKLDQIMSINLSKKVKQAIQSLNIQGYKTIMKNKSQTVYQYKVYSYLSFNGISPFPEQNFGQQAYQITQVNALHLPLRFQFKLKPEFQVLNSEYLVPEDEFDIRGLQKDSELLQYLLQKYPVSILQVDFGILSQLKLHVIDLYSQRKVVEGDDPDEYEFHILRFQKCVPQEIDRFKSDPNYRRFFDINLTQRYQNWTITDIDFFTGAFPFNLNSENK